MPDPTPRPGGWLRCNEAGNCPEVRRLGDGGVEIRSSRRPGEVARLDAGEWETLRRSILEGDWDA